MNLNKFQGIEIIHSMISDHKGIKPEIDNWGKKISKYLDMNILLSKPRIEGEVPDNIRKLENSLN